jgi:UDP-N-acetylglucosamine 2-epimerase (non-hydrolysing)
LKKSEEVFIKEKPDAVMILGDTNSAIAAVVAERMHIPVYHMEAGNRSFDANVPEELNRKMVDHVATFNLPYNDYSMRNLLAEGIHPRFIHKTGSPIREIYEHYKDKIESSTILDDLGLDPQGYFLVSLHRQENVDQPDRLARAIQSLESVRDRFSLPIMVSTHPRTRKKLQALGLADISGITFHDPFGYLDYNKLQMSARCVISDSGTISEESAILGFPAVTIRDSMERPEALEAGTILMTSPGETYQLIEAIRLSEIQSQSMPSGYGQKNFSSVVLSTLIATQAEAHSKWRKL